MGDGAGDEVEVRGRTAGGLEQGEDEDFDLGDPGGVGGGAAGGRLRGFEGRAEIGHGVYFWGSFF